MKPKIKYKNGAWRVYWNDIEVTHAGFKDYKTAKKALSYLSVKDLNKFAESRK